MFTFNRGAWQIKQRELIEQYGYVDTNGRPSLYCTVNSKPNNQGLYLNVEEESVRLYHVDNTLIAQWPGTVLINTFRKKMSALVIVFANSRVNSNQKEDDAYFLTNPDEDNFLDLIRKNIVIVEVRMHLKENSSVGNHGTDFRIEERFLNLCFGNRERII